MIALDTNILVYAIDRTQDKRHEIASQIMISAISEGWMLPVQVMVEFLNVTSRKRRDLQEPALAAVAAIRLGCIMPETAPYDALAAFDLATRHRLQYFDALILTVAARAGATTLYSEDMQHGLTLGPLTVTNPFGETPPSPLPIG